jgi:hypothetical protein
MPAYQEEEDQGGKREGKGGGAELSSWIFLQSARGECVCGKGKLEEKRKGKGERGNSPGIRVSRKVEVPSRHLVPNQDTCTKICDIQT